MPAAAQAHRVYDHYLAELARTGPQHLAVCAFSLVGPRNRIDKITKRLALLRRACCAERAAPSVLRRACCAERAALSVLS